MKKEDKLYNKFKPNIYIKPDAYLNGWAKKCGWKATLVYDSLWRHANMEGESFPSIELMAKEHGVGYNTIRRGLKSLIEHNLVIKEVKRDKKGRFIHNSYTLTDKSQWRETPTAPTGLRTSTAPTGNIHSPHRAIKDTHFKGINIYILSKDNIAKQSFAGNEEEKNPVKEENPILEENSSVVLVDPPVAENPQVVVASSPKEEVNPLENSQIVEVKPAKKKYLTKTDPKVIAELIDLFRPINPAVYNLFGNKTQRKSIDRLVQRYGEEKIRRLIQSLPEIVSQPFAPRITTPYQLEMKLGDLLLFVAQKKIKGGGSIDARGV